MEFTVRKYIIFLVAFCIGMSMLAIGAGAEEASVSLSASGSVCAGDTVMLRVRLSGEEISAFEGEILYDPERLSYQYSSDSPAGWELSLSASYGSIRLLGTDRTGKNPISGEARVVTLVFRAHDTLHDGDVITIKSSSFTVTDREKELPLSDAEYRAEISGQQSSDAWLRELSVRGVTLSPSFSADVSEYRAQVPFSTETLEILFSAAPGASVSVSGEKLSVGENTVRILVTAEDGSERLYTVLVTRTGNPEYTPSGDASLSEIRLSCGTLSPSFRWDIEAYVIYLPFEAAELSVSGIPNHAAARCADIGSTALSVGDNVLRLICTAEDGTERIYVLHAVRMPAFNGNTVVFPDGEQTGGGEDTAAQTGSGTASDTSPKSPDETGTDAQTDMAAYAIALIRTHRLLLAGLALAGIPLVLCLVFLIRRHRKKKGHAPKHA